MNFDGVHAATASVSGVVFIDEATKNDMLDEGEHPVAQAGIPETDDMGMTAITVERARASGNVAYAGVIAPDGFGVGGDMQMVEWDPQYPVTAASNSQDIVNLKAEVSFAGATIMTAMGGGKALSGWGIDVLMMGDDGMEVVEGAPEMLDSRHQPVDGARRRHRIQGDQVHALGP